MRTHLEAAAALASVGDHRGVNALIPIATNHDIDPLDRMFAVHYLGLSRRRHAARAIISAIGDDDPDVVNAALAAVGSMRLARAIDAVIRASPHGLRGNHYRAEALGKIGGSRAIAALAKIVAGPETDGLGVVEAARHLPRLLKSKAARQVDADVLELLSALPQERTVMVIDHPADGYEPQVVSLASIRAAARAVQRRVVTRSPSG